MMQRNAVRPAIAFAKSEVDDSGQCVTSACTSKHALIVAGMSQRLDVTPGHRPSCATCVACNGSLSEAQAPIVGAEVW